MTDARSTLSTASTVSATSAAPSAASAASSSSDEQSATAGRPGFAKSQEDKVPSLTNVLGSSPFYASFKGMFGAHCNYEYNIKLQPSRGSPETRVRMLLRARRLAAPSEIKRGHDQGDRDPKSAAAREHEQHVLLQKVDSRTWVAIVKTTVHRAGKRRQVHSPPLTLPIEYKSAVGAWVMTGSFDAIKTLFTVEGAPENGFGLLALATCTNATVQFQGRLGESNRDAGGIVISCYCGQRLVTQAKIDEQSDDIASSDTALDDHDEAGEGEFSSAGGTVPLAAAAADAPDVVSASSAASTLFMQSIGQFPGLGFLKQQQQQQR